MRILAALGGNALLKRGEPMTADVHDDPVDVGTSVLIATSREEPS